VETPLWRAHESNSGGGEQLVEHRQRVGGLGGEEGAQRERTLRDLAMGDAVIQTPLRVYCMENHEGNVLYSGA
jgi:hypothetical protein